MLLMASSGFAAGAAPGKALEGHWGGDRLQLLLDQTGGTVRLDCSSGTLSGPVRPDADGRFSAVGTFEDHGSSQGPQPADSGQAAPAARYSGELREGTLRLSILPDGAREPRVFELRWDAMVKLLRCL